ncbi:hypothetical protein BIW11_07325 [Tropilaelaps mercedesae]|uniref:G-protein coupled receptors family 1 profile domain-containing protein n=1 Tax=Tropilaelaps mercedesae TaxID=418985 RepID=A0A1V9XUE7_9ACAR|nr:hypothetical protein BIW11_07325 [Tropilaelaps mercedesae]
MEDLDVTDDDEFWENNSTNWCGASCRLMVAPVLALGTLINAALACAFAGRKRPLPANELFMFAIVLIELAYSASFLCDYYLFGPLMQSYSQRHPSETCAFLFYKTNERALSLLGLICGKLRFCLLIASLLILWIVIVYLYLKVKTTPTSVTSCLATFWSEQKLLNCLTLKSTLLVTPFTVMMEIRVLHIDIPLWLEDICDVALLFNFISSAPLFLIICPELRFWRGWRCCRCALLSRVFRGLTSSNRRKSYQEYQQQQQQQQQPQRTTENESVRLNV